MTQFHTIGSTVGPAGAHRRGLIWAFCLALLVPYLPALGVFGLQASNWLAGCPSGFDGPCVVGGLDIAQLGRSYSGPLEFSYRSVHLLHYIAYGAVLVVLSHLLFRTTRSRLTATSLAAAAITIPVPIVETYAAGMRIAEDCLLNGADAGGSCAGTIAAATGIYLPMVLLTWAIVMILPVMVILTVAHALFCLGKDIIAHLRTHREAS